MKSGKKFFYWLGVMDSKRFSIPDPIMRRQGYEGQRKVVLPDWAKLAYLEGFFYSKV